MNIDKDKLSALFNLGEGDGDRTPPPEDPRPVASPRDEREPPQEVTIDCARAYSELAELIKVGKEILANAKYTVESNPDDSESINAASSMMRSLADLVKQFTKIHTGRISHENKKELELMRINAKREMLETKIRAMRDGKLLGSGGGTETPLVPFCQEKVITGIVESQRSPADAP